MRPVKIKTSDSIKVPCIYTEDEYRVFLNEYIKHSKHQMYFFKKRMARKEYRCNRSKEERMTECIRLAVQQLNHNLRIKQHLYGN